MEQQQLILSPSNSGRRSISFSNSPEFEFNPFNSNFPQSKILPADQLFAGGVLLPFHLRPDPFTPETTNPNPDPETEHTTHEPDPEPELSSLTTTLTASKRWTDIFKKNDRKTNAVNRKNHEDGKKKERRGGSGNGNGNGTTFAELNINIWPFSRSRSAGNGGSRPRVMTGSSTMGRKVSSAPCSRSNSGGESKSRKWPASPGRGGGVHLGRSSPILQVRRGGGKAPLVGGSEGGSKAKALNMNVPMCIEYQNRSSCKSAVAVASCDTDVAGKNGGVGSREGGRGGNMFNLRSLFSKKVY